MFALSVKSTLALTRGRQLPLSFYPGFKQVRNLNMHEYQSKALMDKFGVNTQRWRLALNPDEALKGAKELGVEEIVIKAQIHAGGRGKGEFSNGFKSGVHITKDTAVIPGIAEKMLGHRLITKQTPPDGVLVNKLMIAESLAIYSETYFAILMDRSFNGPVMVASPKGGMDIEKVAEETPELIFKEPIDIERGVQPEQTLRLAEKLGFPPELRQQAADQMARLYELFIKNDATQVEVNPFAVTNKGVYAVDAKINLDENASFRHKDIFGEKDTAEEDPREVVASQHGLNYIAMDGNIGCMVNGAGLAMATMDIIQAFKGKPANFLDVGGGANESQVTEAFKILSADPQVKAILVNIFGGIMKCDVIARGIINAARTLDLKIPLVVRLEGTNVGIGKQLLRDSGLKILPADDLNDAAMKAVRAIGIEPGVGPSVEAAFQKAHAAAKPSKQAPAKSPAKTPAAKPAAKPASKPAAKPATKPGAAPKPAAKPVAKPAAKPSAPAAKAPAAKAAAKPAAKAPAKGPAKSAAKPAVTPAAAKPAEKKLEKKEEKKAEKKPEKKEDKKAEKTPEKKPQKKEEMKTEKKVDKKEKKDKK